MCSGAGIVRAKRANFFKNLAYFSMPRPFARARGAISMIECSLIGRQTNEGTVSTDRTVVSAVRCACYELTLKVSADDHSG